MQSFLRLFVISAALPLIDACAPTYPGMRPTTTLPPCCRDDIFDNALPGMNGRALFDPVLVRCPMTTRFICSVREDLVTDPTMVIINGGQTIATGPMGTNAFMWVAPGGEIVNKIGCLNNAAP